MQSRLCRPPRDAQHGGRFRLVDTMQIPQYQNSALIRRQALEHTAHIALQLVVTARFAE